MDTCSTIFRCKVLAHQPPHLQLCMLKCRGIACDFWQFVIIQLQLSADLAISTSSAHSCGNIVTAEKPKIFAHFSTNSSLPSRHITCNQSLICATFFASTVQSISFQLFCRLNVPFPAFRRFISVIAVRLKTNFNDRITPRRLFWDDAVHQLLNQITVGSMSLTPAQSWLRLQLALASSPSVSLSLRGCVMSNNDICEEEKSCFSATAL